MIRTILLFVVTLIIATAASAAWHIYNIPRGEFDRLEARAIDAQGGLNVLGHSRELVDHNFTAVVRPNNDTLYSSAFLDLSDGPLVLTLPEMDERYYSVQFMDPMTEVYEVISRRTRGGAAGTFVIIPPGHEGPVPAMGEAVFAPDTRAWMLIRILIDGPEDLATVHALQDQITLTPWTP